MQMVARRLWVCVFLAVLFLFGMMVADRQLLSSHIRLIEITPCVCCRDQILTQAAQLADQCAGLGLNQIRKCPLQGVHCDAICTVERKTVKTGEYGEIIVPNGVYDCVIISVGQGNGEIYRSALYTADECISRIYAAEAENVSLLKEKANELRFFVLEQLGMFECIWFENSAVN